jgi:hypothetical protein
MAEYLVGTYKASDFGIAVAMITQSGEFSASHDESETPDENGNVKIYQQYNHRIEGSVTLKVPRGVAAPADGSSLSVKCIEVPTYSAQGEPTGGYTLLPSPASTGVDYIVINPSLKTENTTVSEYSCTLRRYLENGVGSQNTDTSDSL